MKTSTIITGLVAAVTLFSADSSARSLQERNHSGRRWRCPTEDQVQCILPGEDRFCCPMNHSCGQNMDQCTPFKPFGDRPSQSRPVPTGATTDTPSHGDGDRPHHHYWSPHHSHRPPPPPSTPPTAELERSDDPGAKPEGPPALSRVQMIIILSILLPLTLLSAITITLYFIHRKRQQLDFEGPASRSTVDMCTEATTPAYLSRPGTSDSYSSWIRTIGSVRHDKRTGSSSGSEAGGWEWSCKGVPPNPVKELVDEEEEDDEVETAEGKETGGTGIALTTPKKVYLKREYAPARPPRGPRRPTVVMPGEDEPMPPLPERGRRSTAGKTESERRSGDAGEEAEVRRQRE